MIVRSAPAKLNLTLEVLGSRPDGYHEIRSVMQMIGLADTISFAPADEISWRSDSPEWDAGKSLVSRAAALLREQTGATGGAAIFVEKRVPLLSGLGGDSSDAAATLLGLNELCTMPSAHSSIAAAHTNEKASTSALAIQPLFTARSG
jgi:4-diphosphocytidyl-2-C-methyl-D-erythritol kinase